MTTLYELRRKPHTSISAIREHLTCPHRYYLKYIREVVPAFKAAASTFGSAWHATLGFWLTNTEARPAEVEGYFRDDFTDRLRTDRVPVLFDDEDESEGRLVDLGIRMLRTFFTRVARPPVVLGVEVSFSLELTHTTTGEVLPVPLIGALDAVVVSDRDRKYIWEFKTAKRRWSSDQVEFDLQVTAYQAASRYLGHGDAAARLLVATKTIHPDIQVEDLVRNAAEEVELLDVIFGVHQAIAAGVDYRLRGWQCRSCPYAEACRP